MIKVNLGAGYHKIEGFTTVDFRLETEPEVVADLEQYHCLAEFSNGTVEEVLASHVLEHIRNLEGLMSEIYRVCCNDAKITIRAPYWSHQTAVEDPTHVRYFTEKSMMYFDKRTKGSDGKEISIPYNFQQTGMNLVAEKEYAGLGVEELMANAKKYLNVIKEIEYTLKVIK